MTDSELLRYARDFLTIGGSAADHLARFVADYLDDSPVTEEALMGMGAINDNGVWLIPNVVGWFRLLSNGGTNTLHWYRAEFVMVQTITTLGQLRHLLRGLGVGV